MRLGIIRNGVALAFISLSLVACSGAQSPESLVDTSTANQFEPTPLSQEFDGIFGMKTVTITHGVFKKIPAGAKLGSSQFKVGCGELESAG